MKEYLDLLEYILTNGEEKSDRTGTGTLAVFGYQLKLNLEKGFPLLTTKKIFFHSVLRELLWFVKGSTNINDGLVPHTKIWNPWADENGELGPVYGYQWRKWDKYDFDKNTKSFNKTHVDQLKIAIETIKTNPSSRRIIVNAWNVADLDRMALPPCHLLFQFYVLNGRLDLQLYQRSADVAIGVPFNIASYSLLLMMVAQECGLRPGNFVHTFGDAHVYVNHIDGVKEQLRRKPGELPRIEIAKKPFFDLEFEDFELADYDPQPFIKLPIAV
ncbi:thymidylate synthase [Candidatus Margulisiibacteriota bacterium]